MIFRVGEDKSGHRRALKIIDCVAGIFYSIQERKGRKTGFTN